MIGIVGGVGPYAGLDVFKKILEETNAEFDQDHLPVMLTSCPHLIGDRLKFIQGQTTVNPARAFADIILAQQKAGITVTAIPSNISHVPQIYNQILSYLAEEQSTIQVLHMLDETIAYIKNNFEQPKVAMLATNEILYTGLYAERLEQAGIAIIEVSKELQEHIQDAIYNEEFGIKAFSEPITNRAKEQIFKAIDQLKKAGATILILGNAELPLAFPEKDYNGVHLIDPNRILARALIAHYDPTKLKKLS